MGKTRFQAFLEQIAEANDLFTKEKIQWLFHTGMLFLSPDKWWGDFKYRASAHEGVDITYYNRPKDRVIRQLAAGARVPAMENGTLLNICPDFLGTSMVVESEKNIAKGVRVVMVYAHVTPENGYGPGDIILKNSCVARICDTRKNPKLPPHLHLSCFEILLEVEPEDLNWALFSKQENLCMIHPVFL